jgi:hypothetical protein
MFQSKKNQKFELQAKVSDESGRACHEVERRVRPIGERFLMERSDQKVSCLDHAHGNASQDASRWPFYARDADESKTRNSLVGSMYGVFGRVSSCNR